MPAETYDIATFRRLIDINLTGTFICAQAAAIHMLAPSLDGGCMTFIASMSGHIVNCRVVNASKAGVIQLAKPLAAEWADRNVRVNSIRQELSPSQT